MTFASKPQAEPVVFNADSLREFEGAYTAAVAAGKASFVYAGREYVVGYAKYLIEYLSPIMLLRRRK